MGRRDITEKKSDEPMADEVRYWLSEIEAAKKREKKYREEGRKVREIYAAKKEDIPFNIVFSNVETMKPAMYSAVPRPVVQRRYKDEDAVGKAAATAAQRMLEFQLDTNIEGYETFNEAMNAATLDGLLPGRGVTSVKYDAEVSAEVKISEIICPESRSWDRVFFGYARKWSQVPWVAYEDFIDEPEAERLFGKDISKKIKFTKGQQDSGDGEKRNKDDDEQNTGGRKTALVYQIWDKDGGRKIRYVSPHYKDGFLKVSDDTLGLTGFFNCPRPIQFVEKTDDMTPTSLYCFYEKQAEELNSLTVRMGKIIKALKVRGAYDSALGSDIENIFEAEENSLVPTEKGGSLAAGQGLDKAIWFMPLDLLKDTLEQLYVARERTKQVIFEIIGIADILRGASDANETLGAQQIKTQWGTLRLRPKQAEVQRYARDLMRMFVEIAARQYSEQNWARMTGLPYLGEQQVQLLTVAAQQGDQNAVQQLQATPKWADVIAVLRDDLQRAFKIDIETNSTLEPEAAEDQKNIADLMNAIGQYLSSVGPLVQQGVMPFEIAQSMLLAITRRFRFGTEIEDQIKRMQPPKPQEQDKSGEMAAQQKLLQLTQQNAEKDIQIKQLTAEKGLQGQSQQLDKRATDLDVKELALNSEKELFRLEQQRAQESLKNASQSESQKLDHKRQLTGLETKQAKMEQGVAKESAQRATSMEGALKTKLEGLTQNQQKLDQAVAEQAEQIAQVAKMIKGKRVRRPIRDQNGDIVQVIDEPAPETMQ